MKRSPRIHAPTLARLPPLTSLRAFVAAARHLSFTQAAEELRVSSAAIGQQVRILEDYVGQPLFVRTARGLRLTPAGRALRPGLTDAFETILESVARLAEGDSENTVRVSVTPSFAGKWLVGRLEGLRRAVPDLRVQLDATTNLVDVERDDIDCVIRYGTGAYPSLVVERLFPEAVVPLCSPTFAETHGLTPRLRALHGVPLLHEEGPEHDASCPEWRDYLRARGIAASQPESGIRLNQSLLVLEAAAAGQGLGLGKLRLAEADIALGRLVVPFGAPQPVEFAYYFATTPRKAKLPQVELFLGWLRAEARSVRDAAEPDAAGSAAG